MIPIGTALKRCRPTRRSLRREARVGRPARPLRQRAVPSDRSSRLGGSDCGSGVGSDRADELRDRRTGASSSGSGRPTTRATTAPRRRCRAQFRRCPCRRARPSNVPVISGWTAINCGRSRRRSRSATGPNPTPRWSRCRRPASSATGVACSVQTGRAVAEAGLHPATGGDGSLLCSGDMLLEALVACAGVTLRAVVDLARDLGASRAGCAPRAISTSAGRSASTATRRSGSGRSGCRSSSRPTPTKSSSRRLKKLTERYCVVYQTLAGGAGADDDLERGRRLALRPAWESDRDGQPAARRGAAASSASCATAIARTIDSPSPWWPSSAVARAVESLERLEQPCRPDRRGSAARCC